MTTLAMAATAVKPSFNLWDAPWIGVVLPDGAVARLGIRACLERAHEWRSFYDPSPLVVGGTHRLLATILQDIYRPARPDEIAELREAGRFDRQRITAYAAQTHARFDLFSEEAPFMQTADLPLRPAKGTERKSIAGLFFEEPSGTNVVHFWHRYEEEQAICPACAAGGLMIQPAFATSGGAGIKPSINGVPPIYVLPAGANLFETLALSLVAPNYQPDVRDRDGDAPLWGTAETAVKRAETVSRVGYLASLTFPARRIRLYPDSERGVCTRCGSLTDLRVAHMVFEMGRSRPDGAALWRDPFAAYREREKEQPLPLRPQAGKALWREYGGLFLSSVEVPSMKAPAVVNQLAQLAREGSVSRQHLLQFRCIGVRTDMKAKIFEWLDETLDVPAGLLGEPRSARQVRFGMERAEQAGQDIRGIFGEYLAGSQKAQGKRQRFQTVAQRMSANYWARLGENFRRFVLAAGDPASVDGAARQWAEEILRTAQQVFDEALEEAGERGRNLQERVQARQACRIRLAGRRKEWFDGNGDHPQP